MDDLVSIIEGLESQGILTARDLFWVGNETLPPRIRKYEIISKEIVNGIRDVYIAHERAIREENTCANRYGRLLHYLEHPQKLENCNLVLNSGNIIGRIKGYTIMKLSTNTDILGIFEEYRENLIVCWDIKTAEEVSVISNIIKRYNLNYSWTIHPACMRENGGRRGVIRIYAYTLR